MTQSDFLSILPLLTLVAWACLLLLVDLFIPKNRKGWTALLAAVGLALTMGLALAQAGEELSGFGGMVKLDGFSTFLAVLFLVPKMGVFGLAWGSVLGAALHLLVQLPALRGLHWPYALTLGLDFPAVREVARLMAPRLVGHVKLSGRRALLDLGGAAGMYAIAFCKTNPDLSAWVFDLPSSQPLAQQAIDRARVASEEARAAGKP